jgi:tetratricopeptide (TPR) repeat protein
VHNGRKLLAARKFQEAVKTCRLGLLENPANVEGRLVLAQALMSLARYDEVIAEARAALELEEDSSKATILLGEALFFKGAYVQAREALARAALLEPDNASVTRLLDELDATVEVGIDESLDEVGDSTRSYPNANVDLSVGDETEIQDLPAALQNTADQPPNTESPEDSSSARQAVEAANKAAEDKERPDPIAGEVKIGTGEVAATANVPAAPEIKVDISKVDVSTVGEVPQDETSEPKKQDVLDETIHTGEIASPSSDADATAAAKIAAHKKPVTPQRAKPPQRTEESHSGARRWAQRKWIGADEAATREAVLVPSPRITTEEMKDSDLFGRGAPTSEQRLKTPGSDSSTGQASNRRSVLVEDGTTETKLSRPEPSGSQAAPSHASGLRRDAQPTASAKPRRPDNPWSEDEDEETRSLRGISQEVPAPGSPEVPRSSLAKLQPPPPPLPPVAKSPFRIPPLAGRSPDPGLSPGPGQQTPGPGLPGPAQKTLGPGLPAPGAQNLPPQSPPRPGPPRKTPAEVPPFRSPDFSGVHFEAPPAAAPAGAAAGKPIIPSQLAQPQATPQTPAAPLPSPIHSPAPIPVPSPATRPVPSLGPGPAATARPAIASTAPTPVSRPRSGQQAAPAAPREHTAPAARYPSRGFFATYWRLLALAGGVLVLIATVILITAALRKDKQKEKIKKHLKEARIQVEIASFRSLKRADKKLLKVLQEATGHKGARNLRLFAASVTAVEFGGSADRAEQMLDKGGHKDDDLLAAARILAALASGNRKRSLSEAKKAAARWPQSIYVAYARGLVALRLGTPDKSLRLLDAITARRAKNLVLHAKIRALLALGQVKDAKRLLGSIPEKTRKAPWVRLLRLRYALASTPGPLALKALDPALSLVADATGRVSPRHKRWAQFVLAEGYGRLDKDAERRRYLARVLTGGGFRDPALAEAVATLQLRWKSPGDAVILIQTVRRRYPDRLTAVIIEARATLGQSKFKEVLRQLDSVEEKRRTPDMNLLRARAALALGKFPKARSILIGLRKSYPNMTGVLVTWAKLLTQEGRLDEALSALENVLKREPRNVEVIRDAARLELRRGKAADAVIRLEVAVRLRARDPELRSELVRAYLAAGNHKSAETSIEAAIAAFPHNPSVLSAKGQLMQILGRYTDASNAFDAALKKKPHLTDALVGRAEVLLASGRYADAEKAVKKAGKAAPESRRLLKGWLYLVRWSKRKSDPWRARSLLAAAAKQKGSNGRRAAVLLLEYYAKAMSRRKGEKTYAMLSKRFGARPELRSALALVRLDDDSYRGAKSQLNTARADPAFSRISPVAQARVYARLAHAYWLAGNYGTARRHARKGLTIWSGCPRALAILGIVAYEMANFSKAKQRLSQALKANANLALAHHYLGKAYKQLGQRRLARRHIRRYLQLRPKGPLAADSKRAL